jgi:MEMO1 family protein
MVRAMNTRDDSGRGRRAAGARLRWLAGFLLAATLARAEGGPRPPAVAGEFYPDDATRLRAAIAAFLADAVPAQAEAPRMLVVPHAGYVYSGQLMADAWRQAAGRTYDVVVILGVNHHAAGFAGISVYDGPGYRTPLGIAACDRALARALSAADRRFAYVERADAQEHSVEVQVPFAQTVLPGVPLVAAVVGGDDPALWRDFGRALGQALQGRRALVVASSDLAHYPPHDEALASDRAVVAAIAGLDPAFLETTLAREMDRRRPGQVTGACGEGALVAALAAAPALGVTRASVLSCANSGDTALGDRERCVGYAALALTAGARASDLAVLAPAAVASPTAPLGEDDRRQLLAFARTTIAQYLASRTAPLFRGGSAVLRRPQGVFVTLNEDGQLRGCIGRLAGDLPLGQAVGAMALQAAFDDPRFAPLRAEELGRLSIEISALTPPAPVSGPRDIVVGRDGVVLRKGGRSAVFLPQVATEQGWDRDELLAQLCVKAGLPRDAWREGAQFSVFQAVVFGEPAGDPR